MTDLWTEEPIYASGWASVPSVRQNQFDALAAKLTSIKSETTDGVVDTGLPVSWDSISIGHRILAQADSAADGWWPVQVQDVDDDMLDPADSAVTERVITIMLAREY
jgi:hypothetical protein